MPLFEAGNQAAKGHGRPKGSAYVAECQTYAATKGWKKLTDLADGVGYRVGTLNGRITEVGPTPELQFEALKLVLAYAVGKPAQAIDISSGGSTLFDWLRGEFRPGLEPERDGAGQDVPAAQPNIRTETNPSNITPPTTAGPDAGVRS